MVSATWFICGAAIGHEWPGRFVYILGLWHFNRPWLHCDNQAFQRSGAKGRSRAQRLNDLLRELFVLMVQYGFVIAWMWISTHDNINADHLSRGCPFDTPSVGDR